MNSKEATSFKAPSEPTQQERLRHNLTHYPFKPWCKHCVFGKGKIIPHRSTSRSYLPVVMFDFTHPKLEETPGTVETSASGLVILTGIDCTTGLAFAAQLPSKSPTAHAVHLVKNFLIEVGRTEAILQSDKEPAIRLVLAKVGGGFSQLNGGSLYPVVRGRKPNPVLQKMGPVLGQIRPRFWPKAGSNFAARCPRWGLRRPSSPRAPWNVCGTPFVCSCCCLVAGKGSWLLQG